MKNVDYSNDPYVLNPRPWEEFITDFDEDGSIYKEEFEAHYAATLAKYGKPAAKQKV